MRSDVRPCADLRSRIKLELEARSSATELLQQLQDVIDELVVLALDEALDDVLADLIEVERVSNDVVRGPRARQLLVEQSRLRRAQHQPTDLTRAACYLVSMSGFDVAIGTALEREQSLTSELRMVKAAILYADRTVLYSPMTALLRALGRVGELDGRQMFQLVEQLAPILPEYQRESLLGMPPKARKYLMGETAESSSRPTFSHKRKRPPKNIRPLVTQTHARLRTGVEKLVVAGQEVLRTNELAELQLAEYEGVIEIRDFPMPARKDITDHVTRVVAANVTKDPRHMIPEIGFVVSGYLEAALSTETYPMLDRRISSILSQLVSDQKVDVSAEMLERTKHGQLSKVLLGELPLPDAPMQEVLELRLVLQRYVPAFRGKLAEFTAQMLARPWTRKFESEARRVFVEKVEPELVQIRACFDASRLPVAASAAAWAATSASIGVTLAPVMSLPQLLMAGVGLSAGAAARLGLEHFQRRAAAEQNALFFYYLAQSRLMGS